LPKDGGSILIITKSLKDVMVLHEMGFDAVAASSETTFIPDDILETLKKKYKHILILYDRDPTGMKNARQLSKEYKLDAFFINKRFKAKDISDAVVSTGFEQVKNWLIKTLKQYD
jgi:5S rRNA maturation endonuclease (ribonuclease M5)